MKKVRIGIVTFENLDSYRDHDLITDLRNWLIRCIEKGYQILIVRGYFKGKYDNLTAINTVQHLNSFIKQYLPGR